MKDEGGDSKCVSELNRQTERWCPVFFLLAMYCITITMIILIITLFVLFLQFAAHYPLQSKVKILSEQTEIQSMH